MYKDLIECTWCEWSGLVERTADSCPACLTEGSLLDIKQDVEV